MATIRVAYAVYWNNAEWSGGIEEVDLDDIWTNENPSGWTYQHIGDIHDTYQDDFPTRQEAEKCLTALYSKK